MPPQSWENSRRVAPPVREQDQVAPIEAPVPFWSSVARSGRDQMFNSNEGGREAWLDSRLLERHREIERLTGQPFEYAEEMSASSAFGRDQATDIDPYSADAGVRRSVQARRPTLLEYERRLDQLRILHPQLRDVPTLAQIRARSSAELSQIRADAEAGAESGFAGGVGAFVGGTGAAILDPINLAAAVTTGGVGAGRPLLTRMAAQAGVGAGVEGLSIPERARSAQVEGGPEYTGQQALTELAFGTAAPVAFEGLGTGAAAVWRSTARQLERSADPASRGMADQIERLLDDEAVIGGSAPDFDGARAALARGDLPPQIQPERDLEGLFGEAPATLRNQRQPGTPGISAEAEYHGRRIHAGQFDPLTVEADPIRFQYKADGDAEGVTGRLRGVERWDPTASGKAILFEDTDGRIIVADGHQRRGLARRLAEQGFEDARLDGYLFRSADGWTARDVRVVAALKNIREGSGAVLDAAKVFREAPAALRDRSLPVTGDFIQSARQLAGLSDDAFRAVINGVIPERFGAVIGEQAGDRPDLHGDLVELLRRGEPRSAEGARALVQEGLLDDFLKSEGRQMDLFGGLPRESTVIARGRIREAVLAALRKDEKLNTALVRNADAIEAGGNVLARTDNEARLAVDRAASELVSRLALRSGEMGEAFSEAAAAVTKGETSPGAAAKGLVQRIRAAVAAGERLDEIRAETIDPSPPSPAALAEAQAFDTPGGAGQRDQIQPKPEDADLEGDDTLGLFDDMPTIVPEERALAVLRACAPGGAA